MKWGIAKIGDKVSIYLEEDILPHLHDPSCPCRPSIIYLSKGQSMKIEIGGEGEEEEIYVANKETTMILHNANLIRLTESVN